MIPVSAEPMTSLRNDLKWLLLLLLLLLLCRSHTQLSTAALNLQSSADAIKHMLPHKWCAAVVRALTIAAISLPCAMPSVQLARHLVEGNPVQHWYCAGHCCSCV
jgi:hypothetical protein